MSEALAPRALASRRRWRCRRGMQELDVLLSRYLARLEHGASSPELDLFDRLLELPDPVLARYLLVHDEHPAEPALRELVERIRLASAP